MTYLKCDLHAHTAYSPDSLTSLETFLDTCQRKGLDRVAVTDHNTITGALQLKELDPERIIVGEEIATTQGELIAYFITQPIPPKLPPLETIARVHAQGGVVGVPHPLDRIRREAMGRVALLPLQDELDFLEVFNSRCLFRGDNRAARILAQELSLYMTGGSDAHSPWELGRGLTILPPFDSPQTFLESLSQAEVRGRRSPIWIHFTSSYARFARRRGRKAPPDPREEDAT